MDRVLLTPDTKEILTLYLSLHDVNVEVCITSQGDSMG